jgi:hypothetical protein
LVIFSRSERKFSFSIRTYRKVADRGSECLKISRLFSLIISILAIQYFLNYSKSQITNELVFEGQVLKAVADHPFLIDSLKGFFTDNLRSQVVLSDSGTNDLIIEIPTVEFKRLGKNSFERSLETILNFQDSTEHSFMFMHRDTLDGKSLTAVRKSRYPELQGRNPRFASKYLGPAVLIGTAIAGIISLFYLRS